MSNHLTTYTLKEAAKLLHCSVDQIRNLITAGELAASNIGTGPVRAKWIVTSTAIDEFLARRSTCKPKTSRHKAPAIKPKREWV